MFSMATAPHTRTPVNAGDPRTGIGAAISVPVTAITGKAAAVLLQGSVPVTSLAVGALGIIDAGPGTSAVGADDAAMLRAMGLVPGATLRVCRQGSPCIVAVVSTTMRMTTPADAAGGASTPAGTSGEPSCSACACGGSRIGLAYDLAKRLFVRSLPMG